MTITPKTPGEGLPDDNESQAPEPSTAPAAADQDGPGGHTGDEDVPETDADSTPGPEPDADPGSAGSTPSDDDGEDRDAAGNPADAGAGEEPADATAGEEAADAGTADGPAEASSSPELDDDTPAEQGTPDVPPAPDDVPTQLDLSGAPTEPERHGGHVTLGGRYELGDVLGTGATFTVYEARPIEDGEDGDWSLVVKVLHPHLVHDEFSRASLQREVDASAHVDHPGVVKVLATGEDDVAGAVVPWTVMRRFPGRLLSEVAAGGGLPWQSALEIVADLLDGLGAVHDAGLVHRDVAPRNVMVLEREDGTYGVGLLDLGLTAPGGGEGDGETVSGSIIGMSPEQAKGQPLDLRSDLYAAGALLYYTITGHAPYERAAAQDVLRAHVEAPVPAPSARKPMVPGAVDRIVARAMAKNPARRYPDAAGMAATIRSLMAGKGRGAGVVVPVEPTEDLSQSGEPTERLDQIAGGTLRVGQIADDAAGHGRTTVVGAYVPSDRPDATEPLPPVSAGAAAGAAGAAAGAVGGAAGAGGRPPVLPGPVPGPPPEEERARRGRVVALAVAGLLVLGAGGLALASLFEGIGGGPEPAVGITKGATTQPKETPSSSSPSSSATDDGEVLPPVTDTPEVDPTEGTLPSGEPSSSPSAPTDEEPSGEPSTEPSTEPSVVPSEPVEPTVEPSTEPSEPVDEEPTDTPTDGGGGSGPGGGSGGGSGQINLQD